TTLGDSVDSVVTKAAPSQLVGSGRRRVRTQGPSTTVYGPRWKDSRTRPPGSRHVDAEEAQDAVPHEARRRGDQHRSLDVRTVGDERDREHEREGAHRVALERVEV